MLKGMLVHVHVHYLGEPFHLNQIYEIRERTSSVRLWRTGLASCDTHRNKKQIIYANGRKRGYYSTH